MNKKLYWILAILLIGGALLGFRWLGRSHAEADDASSEADANAATPAAVVRADRKTIGNTLIISGEFKPFQEVDIHAKVAGYIKVIYVDVGDHVREGQTLAMLEVPELAAQLVAADAAVRRANEEIARAQGDLERAKSSHAAAHLAYTRLSDASKSRQGLVAQQELDDSQAKDLEGEAQCASAKAALSAAQQEMEVVQANKKQVAALSDYTRITAPFTGVITHRYADTGALVAAGTANSTQAMPLVRLAQISVLRLVLPVPESVAAQIHLRDPVRVRVQALNNEEIMGTVSRFADSLDLQTRTMETEIDCKNTDGHLIPGMYANTVLSLHEKKNALTIPLEAVFRNGDDATVLAVNGQNILEERRVKLGSEDSVSVEVLSGLRDGEMVVIGNRSQFRNGQKIQPKFVSERESDAAGGK